MPLKATPNRNLPSGIPYLPAYTLFPSVPPLPLAPIFRLFSSSFQPQKHAQTGAVDPHVAAKSAAHWGGQWSSPYSPVPPWAPLIDAEFGVLLTPTAPNRVADEYQRHLFVAYNQANVNPYRYHHAITGQDLCRYSIDVSVSRDFVLETPPPHLPAPSGRVPELGNDRDAASPRLPEMAVPAHELGHCRREWRMPELNDLGGGKSGSPESARCPTTSSTDLETAGSAENDADTGAEVLAAR
ncbi:hypothetical protein GGF50DRAFT_119596 [Schizophyllum commune]